MTWAGPRAPPSNGYEASGKRHKICNWVQELDEKPELLWWYVRLLETYAGTGAIVIGHRSDFKPDPKPKSYRPSSHDQIIPALPTTASSAEIAQQEANPAGGAQGLPQVRKSRPYSKSQPYQFSLQGNTGCHRYRKRNRCRDY
jgi:hypothetical protein